MLIFKYMHRDRYEPGYFTVEASFIIPMVLLFTIMMIFLSFYSYDRCVLEHSAYQAALQGAGNHLTTADEAYDVAHESAAKLVDGRIFAVRDFTYDVIVDADSVTVRYHCKVNMPFTSWLSKYVSDTDMDLNVGKSAKRYRQVRTIRDCRILNNICK